MIIAVDTNILVKAFVDQELDHLTVVSITIQPGSNIGVCYDHEKKSILREYESNLDKQPLYKKWLQRLREKKRLHSCSGKLPKSHRNALSKKGCHEPSDHIFIAVAFNSDKILISEDSDVGKGPKGNQFPHCEALTYLLNEMGMSIYDASEFCLFVGNRTS